MAVGEVEIEVQAAPEVVWGVVGKFDQIGEWLPGVESFHAEGDVRVIGVFGMEIREELVAVDEDGRSITYRIVGGVPVERHLATISVHPEGEGSRVVWQVEAAPDEMVSIFVDTYRGALAALAARLG